MAAIRCGAWADRPNGQEASLTLHFVGDDGPNLDSSGCPYTQLWQEFRWLEPLYTDFEKRFNTLPVVNWMTYNSWVPIAAVSVYLAFCYFGQRAMDPRTAFKLKKPLAAWNLLLSVFSLIGFLRTAPHLLYFGWRDGFYSSVCKPAEPSFGQGAVGFWVMLFVLSKIPELLDTVFVVLKKRNLIFLHWYHHVTVLLYCWHAYVNRSSTGLYFCAMNYAVHALMYFYYYLAAIGMRPSWDIVVTALQISQMFVGICICAAVYVYQQPGPDGVPSFCDVTPSNFTSALIMYGSYFALFVAFAVDRYLLPKSPADLEKEAAREARKAARAAAAGVTVTAAPPSPAADSGASSESIAAPSSGGARKRNTKQVVGA